MIASVIPERLWTEWTIQVRCFRYESSRGSDDRLVGNRRGNCHRGRARIRCTRHRFGSRQRRTISDRDPDCLGGGPRLGPRARTLGRSRPRPRLEQRSELGSTTATGVRLRRLRIRRRRLHHRSVRTAALRQLLAKRPPPSGSRSEVGVSSLVGEPLPGNQRAGCAKVGL